MRRVSPRPEWLSVQRVPEEPEPWPPAEGDIVAGLHSERTAGSDSGQNGMGMESGDSAVTVTITEMEWSYRDVLQCVHLI